MNRIAFSRSCYNLRATSRSIDAYAVARRELVRVFNHVSVLVYDLHDVEIEAPRDGTQSVTLDDLVYTARSWSAPDVRRGVELGHGRDVGARDRLGVLGAIMSLKGAAH